MSERELPFATAGVIGLGLIGGSVARDLAALGVRVLGYDRDPETLAMACSDGVVGEALDPSLSGLSNADVVIMSVPVSQLAAVLGEAPRLWNARLVTDVGSTKRSAVAAAESLGIAERFVGSHPMAGDHRSGWHVSRSGLFEGARVYLCPTARTQRDTLALAHQLWRSLGASPVEIDADAHDQLLAHASHLPHAAASALAAALSEAGVGRDKLGAGGRDTTRLAGGSVDMWTAISRDNRAALGPAIAELESQLRRLREAIERDDEAAIRAIFNAARAWSSHD